MEKNNENNYLEIQFILLENAKEEVVYTICKSDIK